MIVTVAGLEQFCGDMKRRYRWPPPISDEPERHHDEFAEQLEGATLVAHGFMRASWRVVAIEQWEADPRRLVADLIERRDGWISYRLYEIATASPGS